MNYSEVFDGKKTKEFVYGVELPIETQGTQPLVMDTHYAKTNEVPVYYQNSEVLSFKQCLIMLLSQFLPVVGIVLLFYWAFQSGEISPKKTLARAMLACYAIVAIVFGFFSLFR